MTPQAVAKAKVAMELIEVEENAQDKVGDSGSRSGNGKGPA